MYFNGVEQLSEGKPSSNLKKYTKKWPESQGNGERLTGARQKLQDYSAWFVHMSHKSFAVQSFH